MQKRSKSRYDTAHIHQHIAKVAELVDALDLGSSVARRESSSLSFRTIYFFVKNIQYLLENKYAGFCRIQLGY